MEERSRVPAEDLSNKHSLKVCFLSNKNVHTAKACCVKVFLYIFMYVVDLKKILVVETNNKEFASQELRAVCTITKQNYSVRVDVCSTIVYCQ